MVPSVLLLPPCQPSPLGGHLPPILSAHVQGTATGGWMGGGEKQGAESLWSNLSNIGNKSIVFSCFRVHPSVAKWATGVTEVDVSLLGHNPIGSENEASVSHSQGGQGCVQPGSHGCPKGVCVSENRGCKFAGGHFFPTEAKHRCCQLKTLLHIPRWCL